VALLALSIVKSNLLNLIAHLLVILRLFLLSTAVLFRLFFHDTLLALPTIKLVISFNFLSYHVLSHAFEHVLVRTLQHQLIIVLLLDLKHSRLGLFLLIIIVVDLFSQLLIFLIGFVQSIL